MNKSHETPKPNRNLKRRALVGVLSLAAALGPGAADASASHHKKPAIHGEQMPADASLRARTERRIRRHQPVEIYKGTLGFTQRQQDPITKHWSTVYFQIDNPLVIFRGTPKAETPRDPVTSGDYAFGSVVDKMGQPVVNLLDYNPKTITLVPGTKPPYVTDGILEGGKGSLEFNQLTDPEGQGIPILLDPDGHPELVAYQYTPNK